MTTVQAVQPKEERISTPTPAKSALRHLPWALGLAGFFIGAIMLPMFAIAMLANSEQVGVRDVWPGHFTGLELHHLFPIPVIFGIANFMIGIIISKAYNWAMARPHLFRSPMSWSVKSDSDMYGQASEFPPDLTWQK